MHVLDYKTKCIKIKIYSFYTYNMAKGTKQNQTAKKADVDKRLQKLEGQSRGIEMKQIFSYFNELSCSANTTSLNVAQLINSPAQGDAKNQIQGLTVAQVGVGFRLLLHNTSTNASMMRIILLQTKQGVTIGTNGLQLLKSSDGTGRDFDASTDLQQFYLQSNKGRYTILYDKVIKLSGKGVDHNCNKIVSFYKPYKYTKRSFNDSGQANEKIYICLKSLDPAFDQGTATIEVTGSMNYDYVDM